MIGPDQTPLPERVDVLDHGYVRLVDYMGGDLSIARAARVSYDAAWRAGEDEGSDAKLIRYLWRHAHTTPFEAVTMTFEVHAPIFVFRQWHRHRTWSFNELSARYRELPAEYYIPDVALIGDQSSNNKQGRDTSAPFDEARHFEADLMAVHCEDAFGIYRQLLQNDWPRELARSVLPVNTYSTMFATVDLLNLMRFLTLRCDGHAQYEIRVYADAMRDLAATIAPIAIGAWKDEIARVQRKDERIAALELMVAQAAQTFDDYGDMHARKLIDGIDGPTYADVTAKVERNRELAARMRSVLS